MGWLNNLVSALGNKLNAPPPPNPAPAVPAPPAPAPPPPDLGDPNAMAGAPTPGAYGSLAVQPAQPVAPPAGPTKAHKLLTILQGGLQGALAGRASSEQALIQSGGHRSGGAGMGFEAGYNLPWQHAMQQQQLAQAQAQTAVTQQQSEMVPTPGGPMPLSLAKVFYPASIRAGSAQTVQGMKGDTAESIQGQKGQTAQTVQGMKGATAESVQGQKSQTAKDVANINQGSPLPLDETVANLVGIPEMAGKPVGKGTLTNINKMLEARGYKQQDLGTDGMWLIDKAGNKLKRMGDSPSLARAQARPVQAAADPNNPGALTYMSGGDAIRTGAAAPGSAATQAAKGVAKSATSGKIGEEVGAFNTALQHADLLKAAATALNNGDNRTLNSLKNRFKTEFGSADVTNFQAISNAYSREITKMLSSGHMTDSEIGSSEATLPKNASPQQILGAIDAYKSLATSKMNVRKQQVDQGMKGKANFPQTNAPAAGVTHVWTPQGLQPNK